MHIVLIFFHLAESKHLQLCNVDLEAALRGFSPASLRNVQLHKAGDGSWKDVGGLKHVRQTLVETLQWPAKVRQEGREERAFERHALTVDYDKERNIKQIFL